jgi:hypothetical protein
MRRLNAARALLRKPFVDTFWWNQELRVIAGQMAKHFPKSKLQFLYESAVGLKKEAPPLPRTREEWEAARQAATAARKKKVKRPAADTLGGKARAIAQKHYDEHQEGGTND